MTTKLSSLLVAACMISCMWKPHSMPKPGPSGTATPELFRTSGAIPTGIDSVSDLARVYTVPLYVPSDVTSISVRGANRSFDTAAEADLNPDLALYTSDGAENPTGDNLQYFPAVTIPGDGSWYASPVTPIVRGSDGKVVLLFSFGGGTFADTANVAQGQYAESTTTVVPPPDPWAGPNPNALLWWEFEYRTFKRRIIVFGDSVSVGYSAFGGEPVGFSNAAWMQIGAERDYAIHLQGIPASGSLQTFNNPGDAPFLWDEPKFARSEVVIQAGINDLQYNNLSDMQGYLETLLTNLRAQGVQRIWINTIQPESAYPDSEDTRVAYNTWLKANYASLGIAAVVDLAASHLSGGLADDGDLSLLYSGFDTGDGSHPNMAGQTQIKNAWLAVL